MVCLVAELIILGLKAGLKLFTLVIPTNDSYVFGRSATGPLLFARSALGLAWSLFPTRLMLATLIVEGTLRLLLFSFCLTVRKGVLNFDSERFEDFGVNLCFFSSKSDGPLELRKVVFGFIFLVDSDLFS